MATNNGTVPYGRFETIIFLSLSLPGRLLILSGIVLSS